MVGGGGGVVFKPPFVTGSVYFASLLVKSHPILEYRKIGKFPSLAFREVAVSAGLRNFNDLYPLRHFLLAYLVKEDLSPS